MEAQKQIRRKQNENDPKTESLNVSTSLKDQIHGPKDRGVPKNQVPDPKGTRILAPTRFTLSTSEGTVEICCRA